MKEQQCQYVCFFSEIFIYFVYFACHLMTNQNTGKTNEVESDIAVNCVLPQPAAESKR